MRSDRLLPSQTHRFGDSIESGIQCGAEDNAQLRNRGQPGFKRIIELRLCGVRFGGSRLQAFSAPG